MMSSEKNEHAFKTFTRDMKEGRIPAVIVMYGEESYLIKWAVESLVKKYVSKDALDFDFVKIDDMSGDFSFSGIVENCDMFSMMSERRLVWVRDFAPLSSDKAKGFPSSESEKFLNYIHDPNEGTILILSSETCNTKLAFTADLLKHSGVYCFDRLEKPQLRSLAEKRFAAEGVVASPAVVNYFIEESGYLHKESDYHIFNLENDIKKIAAVGDGLKVTQGDIDMVLKGDNDTFVFNFLDALSYNRKSLAFEMMENMLDEGEEVYKLIGLLVNNFELILQVKEFANDGLNIPQIASKLRMKDFRVKKASAFADRLSAEKIKLILSELYETDRNIKTGLIDQRLALELFLGRI